MKEEGNSVRAVAQWHVGEQTGRVVCVCEPLPVRCLGSMFVFTGTSSEMGSGAEGVGMLLPSLHLTRCPL